MKHKTKNKKTGKNPFHVPCSMFHERGFTLLEVIISIFVLSVGTLTVIGLIADSLQVVGVTKNSVIAANLAQEGVEIVRGIRDGNWIQAEEYDNELPPGDSCVDYDSTGLIDPCGDFTIYWDDAKYSHNSAGDATPFERVISIAVDMDSEGVEFLRVQATVSWDSREIVVEDHLYDWR